MIFSLEVLRAKHGDSLLLHYGDADDPKLIVIDGGPRGVCKDALLPRLEELRDERGGELTIENLMVSHVDQDHVRGVLDFAQTLDEDDALRAGFKVKTLWLDSFEDTVGDGSPIIAGVGAAPAGAEAGELAAEIASVGEGRSLRNLARKFGWPLNKGFDELVMAPDDAGVEIDLGPLRLTVVGPRAAELEELRKEWAKEVEKLVKKEKSTAKVAEYLDDSVYNLSSIVCLAELGGKRMLLTGDARGDKILLGLEKAGLLPKGKPLEVDVLKMPHHGSSRNLEPEFFERIKAREMVISANGKDENPDLTTLKMISEVRKDDDFTLYLTYADFEEGIGPGIHDFFEQEAKDGRKYKVVFRPEDDLSMRLDLLDAPG
ncbi:MAG TPA: hypothetical protein VFY75_01250 [Solirubrobacterales bacterium]|nr:hypothetical protein [Solirubrobacterales bacterium]